MFETAGAYVGIGVHTGTAVNALTWVASNYGYGQLLSSKVVFSVTEGTVYRIAVDSAYSARGAFTLSWRRTYPPPNDDFGAAQTIGGLSGSVQGTTFAAGTEAGEPMHDGHPRASIWYRWVPQFDGHVRIDDAGSEYDNVLALYRGTSLTALTKLEHDRGYALPSIVEADVLAGSVYYVVLDSADWPGEVTLNWRTLPPDNDAFETPESLWADGGSLTGVTAAATKQPNEPNHAGDAGGHSVWFRWTSLPGTLTIETTGSDFDALLAAYTGTAVSALTPVAWAPGHLTFHVDGEVPYSLALDGRGGASGNYRITWSFQADPPANDDFAAAQQISLEKNWIRGRTISATKEPGEPDHGGNAGGHSVWYRWVAPRDGLAVFDTYNSEPSWFWPDTTFDSTLGVYRGASVGGLTAVAGNDDHDYLGRSRVAFPVEKGEEYAIAVDGRGNSNGYFALNWNVGPPNDDFAFRHVIGGPRGAVVATTADSTWEGYDGGSVELRNEPANVWFLWRAPASGDVRLDVTASSYAPGIRVWTGPNYATLRRVQTVGAVEGKTVWAKFRAAAGTVYRVEVLGDGFGPFALSWEPTTIPPPPWPSPPANDDFADAQPIAGQSGSVAGTNEYATLELDEPEHDLSVWNGYSVWYRWTAPFTGTAAVDTTGSDFTTIVAVYGGDRVERARRVAGVFGAQTLRVGVTAGTVYSIAVAGSTRYDPLGNLVLNWRRHAAAPTNDGFAAPATLPGAVGTVDFSTAEASAELDEPRHGNQRPNASLWWSWTAPASGPVSFQTSLGPLETRLGVYEGSSLAALTTVATNDESANGGAEARVVFAAEAGTTYRVAVDSAAGGAATLSWRMPPSPPNDAFANATPLPLAFYSVYRYLVDEGDNIGATREPGEPVHAGVAGSTSVWYRLRWDSGARTLALSTAGSEFDTVVGVYTGSSVDDLTQVAANDDSASGGGDSFLTFQAVGTYSSPTTYWIAVDGKTGQTGKLALAVNPVGEPLNDHFHNASPIVGATGSVTAGMYGASVQHGEPTPEFSYGGSIWLRWTAPSTGTWRFDLQGTQVATAFGVYSGSRVGDLVDHGSTDDEWRLYISVEAGRTYSILLNGDPDDSDPVVLNWRPATAPPHDRFAAAQILTGAGGSVSASTLEASREVGEPRVAGSAGGASLWYGWTAPFTGTAVFDGAGSTFDAVVGVSTGTSLSNLVPVAQNDDFAGELVPSVRFEAMAGTTYLIALDASSWSPDVVPRGQAALNWLLAPPPANDRFGSAQVLTGASGSAAGSTTGARREADEPEHSDQAAGASVWYEWTAPHGGSVLLDASASDFPAVLGVYRGETMGALEVVRRSDDLGGRSETLTFAATAGDTYRIAVDGHIRATGTVSLVWAPVAPANDAFGASEPIANRGGNTTGVTRGATSEAGEPRHGGVGAGTSVWFHWRAPASEAVTFDTHGSDFDTVLGVYTGDAVDGLTTAGSSDDAGATTSSVRLEVTEGTVYRIAVDGKGTATGNVVLNWFATPTPPNDHFADAEALGGRAGWIRATTFGATREPGEPDHAGGGGRHSAWYRFKAPATGSLTLWTEDIWFDTVIAAYRGADVAQLTELGRDDDSGGVWNGYEASKLTLAVSRGSVYWVAVDGKAATPGAFLLRWRLPPPNDAFANAQLLSGASGSVAGTTHAATADAGGPTGDAVVVWYRWTAPTAGTYVFDTAVTGDRERPSVAVYAGAELSALAQGGTYRDPGRFGASPATTYVIAIAPEWSGAAGEFTLSWRRDGDAPANDNVAGAAPISGSDGRASGVVLDASREPREPYHGETGFSVWHSWTAPAGGTLHLNTEGTTYDSDVALYTGTTVDALTAVPSERSKTGGFPSYSHLRASVTAGTTYLIAVDGVAALGSYVLRYALNPPTPPSGSPYTRITSGPAGAVASADATLAFSSSPPATFQCRLDGSPFAACSSPVSYAGLPVGTHTFEVKGANGVGSESVAARRTWRIAAPPSNDAFSSASTLTGHRGSAVGAYTGATREAGEPEHAGRSHDRSVWYRWTAPRDGIATVAVTWSSVREPLLGVYTGSSIDGLTAAPGILPPGSSPSPDRVLFRASAGETYSFAVAHSHSGTFRVGWQLAPLNDDRRNAVVLTGEMGSWSGDNIGASREGGEARHGGDGGGASIWFRWIAPTTGTLTLDTSGSEAGLDTTLGVYTSSPYWDWHADGAVPRAADDDSAADGKSRVSLEVFKGTAYDIAVDGFDGAMGAIVVQWSFSAPVAPTPPTVALTSPADGALVREDVPLAATAADADGIERVEFLVNSNVVAVDRSEPYATTWDSTSIADGPATVRARAVDLSSAVALSAPRSITIDNTPPETHLDEGPAGTTSSRDAVFEFSSNDRQAQFECALDSAPLALCTSPRSYSGLGDGDHTFQVRAIDNAGNADESPALRTWTVVPADTTPPETTLSSGPAGVVASTVATFEFTSEPGASFECSLDGLGYSPCASPTSFSGLVDGPHQFRVRAKDAAGNTDSSPAERTWTVDTTPPETAISGSPPDLTGASDATFTFTSEAGATFECSLDGSPFAACSSPRTYSGLADGDHTFRVRAEDGAGNTDPSPAEDSWTIDSALPETAIGTAPPPVSNTRSASFTFTSTKSDSSFECRLDGGIVSQCPSPKTYAELAEGDHVFEVVAISSTGRRDPSPAVHHWSIDTTPPETTLDRTPPAVTNSRSATFAFHASESARLECSLDGAAFATCASPLLLAGLGDGAHTLEVRATDLAGNQQETPATHGWIVDTLAPETAIMFGPHAVTESTNAELGFSTGEPGSSLECSLDGESFRGCTSPVTYIGLALGSHSFRVRARDTAGNLETTPAEHSWTITQAQAPPPPPSPPAPPQPPPTTPPTPSQPPTRIAPTARCVVPRLTGRTLKRSRTLIAGARCRLGRVTRVYSARVGPGRVVKQRPRPGLRLKRGARIDLTVSLGRR